MSLDQSFGLQKTSLSFDSMRLLHTQGRSVSGSLLEQLTGLLEYQSKVVFFCPAVFMGKSQKKRYSKKIIMLL